MLFSQKGESDNAIKNDIDIGNEEYKKPLYLGDYLVYWDISKETIIKDDNYFKILNNKGNIDKIIEDISSTEVITNSICGKNKSFKKGDIAYIFLRENRLISDYKCLHRQFDVYSSCVYPEQLLNYIEENREFVKNNVKDCYIK